jgi:hypothetical protein
MQRFPGFPADERGIVRTPARHLTWFHDPAGNILCVGKEL